jgi:hypothetical protein
MMSMLCNCCVRKLLILARTWFAFGLPSKTGCDSLGQYLTDEVDWPLDGQCMPLFSSLNHDCGADHLSGSGDVDQEGFSGSGGHQDGRVCKERL